MRIDCEVCVFCISTKRVIPYILVLLFLHIMHLKLWALMVASTYAFVTIENPHFVVSETLKRWSI